MKVRPKSDRTGRRSSGVNRASCRKHRCLPGFVIRASCVSLAYLCGIPTRTW
jgi:hypothetical protein